MLPFSHSIPGLMLAALVSLFAGGLASARPWTNTEGKTIEAEYVSHTATAVVLSINGKQVTYATDKLSQADRDYLTGLDATPAVPKGPVVKGKREGLKFTTYLFPTWEDYYKDRDRKSVLKGFENGAFNNTQWGKTEEWLKRDAEKDTYRMVVPPMGRREPHLPFPRCAGHGSRPRSRSTDERGAGVDWAGELDGGNLPRLLRRRRRRRLQPQRGETSQPRATPWVTCPPILFKP